MNAQTAHTPRTDAQAQTVFTDAGTINAVPQDFARTLERENAQLVEQNERMRQALTAAAGHFESHAHAMSATGWNLTAGVMKEQARECRAALNPPPTK